MTAAPSASSPLPQPGARFFRAQDFAWLLFTGALLWGLPETNYNATILIVVIGAFQIIEPRLKAVSSRRGQLIFVAIKLILSYLLVGWTHTIDSPLYPIFLVPIIAAATAFDFWAVFSVTLIASLSYLSFLLLVPPNYILAPDLYSVLSLRVSFFFIVGFVVFEQARGKRIETERTKEANKNLQQAQVSLRRSERLAALGQLTAGLAHELRNPLGTIKASAEMLNQETLCDKPQVMKEMASYIESEVDRMNVLITSFLNFARPLEIHPVKADLNEVLNDITRRQSPLAASRKVTLTSEITPEAASFTFDPAVLSIALSNLVQNAIQASPEGTTVGVKAEKSGGEVVILVEDQGEGISPQNLENIFNPFFTTKSNGVGLGLAIVAKIIDEHQGKITTTSTIGKGTTFRITLPANPERYF
jgi:signal transduction histidine kinase